MAEAFATLVAVLARLEDELPHVTESDLGRAWPAPAAPLSAALVAAALADGRLFHDERQQLDAATGAVRPVRLLRLNRRHPAVAALLE